MPERLKVLQVTPTFYPATHWGGPIFSSLGLCNALVADPAVDLRVLCTDSAGPHLSQRVEVTGFPQLIGRGIPVYFCRKRAGIDFSPSLFARLPGMVRWADVVHLTGVYSWTTPPTLALCHWFGKPVVWSPRGSLQRWQGTRKSWLKGVWERVCRHLAPDQTALHVTSPEEAEASGARMPGMRVAVVQNGIEVPSQVTRSPRGDGPLRALYLGRLHPIKGIENLLDAVAQASQSGLALTLDVHGGGDEQYTRSLQRKADALQLGAKVRFHGVADENAKRAAYAGADVCVVPSFSENFGMVVAEALAHGVPVIASRGTPWQEVESRACGLWVNNDPASLAAAMNTINTMDLALMGERGHDWMKSAYGWAGVAHQMKSLYEDTAGRGCLKVSVRT